MIPSITRITLGRLVPASFGQVSAGLVEVEVQSPFEVNLEPEKLSAEVVADLQIIVQNSSLEVQVRTELEVAVSMITVDVGICHG